MKKIILSMVMLTSTIALAQVKVGTDVTNLATNANFQVEGAAPTNQFVVMNDGKVGIGTTAPLSSLDVRNGAVRIEQATTVPTAGYLQLYNTDPTDGNGASIMFRAMTSTGTNREMANIRAIYTNHIDASRTADLVFGTVNGGSITVRQIIKSDGSIGIGTTTPAAKLDVAGNMKLLTTPTITTATKVLVKDPATNVISEQVVTGTQVETVSIAATPYQVVTGNTLHNTASTGVILTSPNGGKWLLTVNDDGSFKSTAVTP